jgi:AAA domain/Domain of unknown function (DUF3854)
VPDDVRNIPDCAHRVQGSATATSPVADLSLHHYEAHIAASDIYDIVARERGYRTVTQVNKGWLRTLGFNEDQLAHLPGLLIPQWDVHGESTNYVLRPNVPRNHPGGKVAKYEQVPGKPSILDVHPRTHAWAMDVAVPLVVTEGIKKADAIISAKRPVGPTVPDGRVMAVALQGVCNWCTGGVANSDWWAIKFRDGDIRRETYVCFDSDVMVKPDVHRELGKLVAFLKSRGAAVKPIYLPPGPNGAKVGIDDFLVAGHTITDAFNLAEDELRPLQGRRTWLTFAELLNLPPQPWLIEGLLPAEGITVLYGTWGAYKSFVVLDWLGSVAAGATDWFGVGIKRTGPAVYVYAEGRSGLAQRVQALKSARRLPHETPLVVWPTALDIADAESVEGLTSDIANALGGKPPVLIAIDTLARNMPGGDENKQQDMSAFLAGCDRLRTEFNCQVVVVHHTNKEGAVRGSTVLPGAADTLIEVERQGDNETQLSVRKQKDGEEPAWVVRLRPEGCSLTVAGIGITGSGKKVKQKKDDLLDHEKKMLVFRALAKANTDGLPYNEWFCLSDVSKGTFAAAKALMEDRDFVRQDPETKRYHLSGQAVDVASSRGWIESSY